MNSKVTAPREICLISNDKIKTSTTHLFSVYFHLEYVFNVGCVEYDNFLATAYFYTHSHFVSPMWVTFILVCKNGLLFYL